VLIGRVTPGKVQDGSQSYAAAAKQFLPIALAAGSTSVTGFQSGRVGMRIFSVKVVVALLSLTTISTALAQGNSAKPAKHREVGVAV
jgi:hypothetical protein